MKKYKVVSNQDFLDDIYEMLEKYNLSDEEKKEVDIIITEYTRYLQKINSIIDNKEKVKLLSEVVKKILEE